MPATPSLAEVLIESLAGHGVRRLFGIPGGGSSLALIEAAGKAGIDVVLTRTETAAAFMAAVTAELSATPGVVFTGIGPGAASAVNGVAYAHLERAPVLHVTDGPASSLHQAFDQKALFAPVTKAQARLRPDGGRAAVEAAIGRAMARPWGPVHLEMTAADANAPVADPGDPPPPPAAPEPEAADLEQARRLLGASKRPVLIAGLEARHGDAPAALRRLAEALACPVLLTYKAKGTLPDSHPGTVGMFTGAAAEADCITAADLIVLFGFDPVEMIPGPWPYEAPILDLRAAPTAELPVPSRCRVTGSLGDMVGTLLPLPAAAWPDSEIAGLRDAMRTRLRFRGSGHTPQTVVEAASAAAPAGCRVAIDAGAHMFSAFAFWDAGLPFGVLKSNGLSTMGFALPAAIASALHEPDRPVIAITGDGGMMMCLSELTTAAERGCSLVVVVVNDAALSLIDVKQQRQQLRSLATRYSAVDFAAAARALGCRAWRVGDGDALAPVLAEAFAGGGPALIDVVVDAGGYGDQLAALRG